MNKKNLAEWARSRRLLYEAAERAVLRGQAYTVEGLSLTRADLSVIKSEINKMLALETSCSGGGGLAKIKRFVPRDF